MAWIDAKDLCVPGAPKRATICAVEWIYPKALGPNFHSIGGIPKPIAENKSDCNRLFLLDFLQTLSYFGENSGVFGGQFHGREKRKKTSTRDKKSARHQGAMLPLPSQKVRGFLRDEGGGLSCSRPWIRDDQYFAGEGGLSHGPQSPYV